MKFCLVIIFSILAPAAFAQYYYNDILNVKQLNKEYGILKKAGFHTIRLESFDENDSPSEGFFCERKINSDFSVSEMVSKSNVTQESKLNTFYSGGRAVKTINETPATSDTTIYQYDANGNLIKIRITSVSKMDSSSIMEERDYSYDSTGQLIAMARKKNGKRISTINFKSDEKGNIIEETPAPGSADRKYYYYYDDSDRLTDVVHFNTLAQKLLPDFMFVYDENNHVKQMISVDESERNYLIWRYAYTAAGLPEIQKCYSRQKSLLGTIQYDYQN